jgi:adenylosuccinate synthase
VGIFKAYTTRVGAGPFPTELDDEIGRHLLTKGEEFGSTTGRPRRCGWLDLPLLKTAVRLNGFSHLCVTKLDVLSGVDPIRVCVAYELGRERLDELPSDPEDVAAVRPIYREFPGWQGEIRNARSLDALPAAARAYLEFIEIELGVPISLVSVGPGRHENAVRWDGFAR